MARAEFEGHGGADVAAIAREARALDQVLVKAQGARDGAPPSNDLMQKIMAAAGAGDTTNDAGMAPQESKDGANNVQPIGGTRPARRDYFMGRASAAAALLAASLVLGIFIGSMERVQTLTADTSRFAGLSSLAGGPVYVSEDDGLHVTEDEGLL